jgi:uncharacterized coiled-coil protein SlyX
MSINDQLTQVNQTLELAVQQLNELLHSAQISGEQINRIQSINNRIRELENDPDFEKTLPELNQLYTELWGYKEHLNAVLQESLSSEQLGKLKQNIYLLSELNQKLTQAPPEPERVEAAIRYVHDTLAAIAGDPTISPSLIHVIKQSQAKLEGHLARKDVSGFRFDQSMDLNVEFKREIWENILRAAKAIGIVNKRIGNDIDSIPYDNPTNLDAYYGDHFRNRPYPPSSPLWDYFEIEYFVRQIGAMWQIEYLPLDPPESGWNRDPNWVRKLEWINTRISEFLQWVENPNKKPS